MRADEGAFGALFCVPKLRLQAKPSNKITAGFWDTKSKPAGNAPSSAASLKQPKQTAPPKQTQPHQPKAAAVRVRPLAVLYISALPSLSLTLPHSLTLPPSHTPSLRLVRSSRWRSRPRRTRQRSESSPSGARTSCAVRLLRLHFGPFLALFVNSIPSPHVPHDVPWVPHVATSSPCLLDAGY